MSDETEVTEASPPSAVAPKEEMEEQHKEMAMEMFQKVAEYLNGELAGKKEYFVILVPILTILYF